MRIDPKYFNVFLVTTAALSLILILYFTFQYTAGQRTDFVDTIGDGSAVRLAYLQTIDGGDSMSVAMFNDHIVVLDFWATWSPRAASSHEILNEIKAENPEKLIVLAASVKDDSELVREYRLQSGYDFIFVNGSDLFNTLRTPGVPTQIIFRPDGSVLSVNVGFSGPDDYQKLRNFLKGNGNGRI